MDPNADPRGGTPVCIVDAPDIEVTSETRGVVRVRIAVTLGAQVTFSTVTAMPDLMGQAMVGLHLPQANIAYVIQGNATPADPNLPSQPLGAFRIMFVSEP